MDLNIFKNLNTELARDEAGLSEDSLGIALGWGSLGWPKLAEKKNVPANDKTYNKV